MSYLTIPGASAVLKEMLAEPDDQPLSYYEGQVLEAARLYAQAVDAETDCGSFSEHEDGNEWTRARIEKECREMVEVTQANLRARALQYRTAYDNDRWDKHG